MSSIPRPKLAGSTENDPQTTKPDEIMSEKSEKNAGDSNSFLDKDWYKVAMRLADGKNPDLSSNSEDDDVPKDFKEVDGTLWVDKYSPKASGELVGNTDTVVKVRNWLQSWIDRRDHPPSSEEERETDRGEKILGKKTKIPRKKMDKRSGGGGTYNAVLLSGDPGIGKTAMAHLLPKELGFDLFELNASDERSKLKLMEFLENALSTDSNVGGLLVPRCVLLDEVDGMHGGENSGGIQYLISKIKTSQVPIICTCNQRELPKIQSLAKHCYDLKLRRPHRDQISTRLSWIARRESLLFPRKVLLKLADISKNDIRMSINLLFSLRGYVNLNVTENMVEDMLKDVVEQSLGFFTNNECVNLILQGNSSGLTDDQRRKLVFNDYDNIPWMILDNYHKALELSVNRTWQNNLRRLRQASKFATQIEDLLNKVYFGIDPNEIESNGRTIQQSNIRLGRDYRHMKLISYIIVQLGNCIESPLPFPDRSTRLWLYMKIRRKQNLENELRTCLEQALPDCSNLPKLLLDYQADAEFGPEKTAELDEIMEQTMEYLDNTSRGSKYFRAVVLPRLRERLLEPLIMEEENATLKVAQQLQKLNLTPRHLLVHMRELLIPKDPDLGNLPGQEEDLYPLLSDKMKTNLLKDYKRLLMNLPDEDGVIRKISSSLKQKKRKTPQPRKNKNKISAPEEDFERVSEVVDGALTRVVEERKEENKPKLERDRLNSEVGDMEREFDEVMAKCGSDPDAPVF